MTQVTPEETPPLFELMMLALEVIFFDVSSLKDTLKLNRKELWLVVPS